MTTPYRTPHAAAPPPWVRVGVLLAVAFCLLLGAAGGTGAAASQAAPPRPPAAVEPAEGAPESAASEADARTAPRPPGGRTGGATAHRTAPRAETAPAAYAARAPVTALHGRCPVLRC